MAENYFPRAEDFDEMGDHLEMIANALVNKVEVDMTDWASIQRMVRMGIAPDVIPVGTQLVVNHSGYGDIVVDVVAHDHYKASHNENAHTMTLMCHDVITSIRFDEPEAFYSAKEGLSAGTYNFTLSKSVGGLGTGTYQFTLSNPLSKGGLLVMIPRNDYGSSIESKSVAVFNNPYQPEPTATCAITKGSGGTSLGKLGISDELNHLSRVLLGSNNYKESAVRQFVNSTAEAGSVWKPQTKFDFRPEWYSALSGFAKGLDKELLSMIGEVKVPCVANTDYESPDSTVIKGEKYTLNDKFYIPSYNEIEGGDSIDGSTQLPYFKGSSSVDRIKKMGINSSNYWLRSCTNLSRDVDKTSCISSTGLLDKAYPSTSAGVVPMFNIV